MVADDHALVRLGIRNALKDLPEVEIVAEVSDGVALFAALVDARPDLLLIDVAMPQFDPIAAVQRIREDYPATRILVISAHDDTTYVQGVMAAGADGYYLKGETLADLRLAVERVLAGDKWLSGVLVEKVVRRTPGSADLLALTTRQRDLLQLLQLGMDNQTIARRLGLSVKTVENNLTRLYRQMGVQGRLEAVALAGQYAETPSNAGDDIGSSVSGAAEAGSALGVMVVDDNARYRCQLRQMIRRIYPWAVVYEAEDSDEALHIARRVKPRLAFVDAILGEEDGIQCVRRVKNQSPDCRIVLISAYPDREFHRCGAEAGAVAFVDKADLRAATLREMIADLIR